MKTINLFPKTCVVRCNSKGCCNTLQKKRLGTYALAIFICFAALSAFFQKGEGLFAFLILLIGGLLLAVAGYYRPRSCCPASYCPESLDNPIVLYDIRCLTCKEPGRMAFDRNTLIGTYICKTCHPVPVKCETCNGSGIEKTGIPEWQVPLLCTSCQGSGWKDQTIQAIMPRWEEGHFKYGLFDCFKEIPSCILGSFCPCVQFGLNYEKWHKDGCLLFGFTYLCVSSLGCPCLAHGPFRIKMRHRFNISSDWCHEKFGDVPCEDALVTTFCSCCALIQESRELAWRQQEANQRDIQFEEMIYL